MGAPCHSGHRVIAMKDIVFLFDVDNTLLDNDRVQDDLRAHLAASYGEAARDRYWAIFEELRGELGYADYLGALDAVRRVAQWGPTVVLSDGDAVFQPRKVERSGIWKAFDGNVLIYIHKEQELDDVERFYPAKRYVLIDDKLRILAAVRAIWGDRVTTVFPRQGHFANDQKALAQYPRADIQIERIGDLAKLDRAAFTSNRDDHGVRT